MALSGALAKAGNPPERLQTSATVTFVPGRGSRRARSPSRDGARGSTRDGFLEAAEGAKQNCPVSKALAGVPEITLDAASSTRSGSSSTARRLSARRVLRETGFASDVFARRAKVVARRGSATRAKPVTPEVAWTRRYFALKPSA